MIEMVSTSSTTNSRYMLHGIMSVRDRVARHRIAMRERGFRQIQMWVPDARTEEFKREARRQSLAVAAADRAGDDQDFIEQISEDWPA